jgi:hypothetical protein
VIDVYRDTSALSEGAPLYHPPHAKKAYSAAAHRTADRALAANHLAGLQNYSAHCRPRRPQAKVNSFIQRPLDQGWKQHAHARCFVVEARRVKAAMPNITPPKPASRSC